MSENRYKLLYIFFAFAFFIVVARSVYWQIKSYNEKKYVYQNTLQKIKYETLNSNRGEIKDTEGNSWAKNQLGWKFTLYKPEINSFPEVKKIVQSNYPSITPKKIQMFFDDPEQKWVEDIWTASPPALVPKGINFSPYFSRSYPQNNLAKNIIGSLDANNTGVYGIEKYYNQKLSAYPGFWWGHKDATGNLILGQKSIYIPPQTGTTLNISLNRQIQQIAENEAQNAKSQFDAQRVMISIINSKTGAVLALASTYDQTEISQIPNTQLLFEPGSIFKPLIVAAALETNTITPNHTCSICNKDLKLDDATISNWDEGIYPNSDIKTILKNSDNIAMAEIGLRLGKDKILSYLDKLKLITALDIDLPGSAKPFVKSYWSRVDTATAAFGQGVVGTQLHFLQAFNALSRGKIIPAYIVTPKDNSPVFSTETLQTVQSSLLYATNNGAVGKLNKNNLDFCGKSGTAQIAANGSYSIDLTNASYIGFYPCFDPKISMIVTVMKPKSSPWGATTAAPVWLNTLEQIQTLVTML